MLYEGCSPKQLKETLLACFDDDVAEECPPGLDD